VEMSLAKHLISSPLGMASSGLLLDVTKEKLVE
jgi:hypothetical protein